MFMNPTLECSPGNEVFRLRASQVGKKYCDELWHVSTQQVSMKKMPQTGYFSGINSHISCTLKFIIKTLV